jgi:hypothetical protein
MKVMEENLQKILDELKLINQRINSINQDVQFIKSIFTTPRPTKTKKVSLSKEERSRITKLKLLKIPRSQW